MTIADRYECFNLEKIVEEIRDIDIETLKNNISDEKDEGKRYNNHLSEERIQQIVIAYLDDKNIICEPSMSGIRIKSFKTRIKMREQGVKKGYPDLTIKKYFIGKVLQGIIASIYTFLALKLIPGLNLDVIETSNINLSQLESLNSFTLSIYSFFYSFGLLIIGICALFVIFNIFKKSYE